MDVTDVCLLNSGAVEYLFITLTIAWFRVSSQLSGITVVLPTLSISFIMPKTCSQIIVPAYFVPLVETETSQHIETKILKKIIWFQFKYICLNAYSLCYRTR